ncbi:hypothetical protein Tco_0285858 [Tanacetum coccineum]
MAGGGYVGWYGGVGSTGGARMGVGARWMGLGGRLVHRSGGGRCGRGGVRRGVAGVWSTGRPVMGWAPGDGVGVPVVGTVAGGGRCGRGGVDGGWSGWGRAR